MITLIPNMTSLVNPASYRKSQDFSISSNMILSCTSSLAISIKWTIGNCSSACSAIQPNQSIITTSSELFIPARTLDYGTYELKVTVRMLASSNLKSSVSTYVTITRSGITANLVPLGTSIVTSGRQSNLTLNPGSYSIDPDAQTFNASVNITKQPKYSSRKNFMLIIMNRIGIMFIIVDHTISMIQQVLFQYRY